MDTKQIIKYIDDGAKFYCRQLGNASHMEFKNNGIYSMISPKAGEEGGTSLFDVTLEHLSDEAACQKIDEIRALNVHTWWGLCVSDRIADLIWGKDRPVLSPEQHENDEEFYMAIFPEDKPVNNAFNDAIRVMPVMSLDAFGIWADICNAVLHSGYPIMHRVNHFHLCEEGIMSCYLGFYNDKPVAVSAILNNKGISSLEFVATLPDYRKKGLAKALTITAIYDAFDNGSIIITTRAFADAKNLYKSLGFKIYYVEGIVSRPESIENRWDILYRDYPEVYEAFTNTPYHPTVYEQLPKIIDLRGKCIADVGAGTGSSSLALARSARLVIGIEREAAMLRQAQQKARGENIIYMRGDALALPLADASVDVVTGITLALYPPGQYRDFIREGLRVAKGAVVFLGIPPGWYGGDLYEVIEDFEKVDDAVDHIFIEEFQFAYQDIFSDQEYGTVEHIVSTYGFIFGKKAIEHLKRENKTTIRWKFRVYWRE